MKGTGFLTLTACQLPHIPRGAQAEAGLAHDIDYTCCFIPFALVTAPMPDVFAALPASLDAEVFDELLAARHVRIERIISQGHTSPAQGWHDQAEHEWVLVLEGAARLLFESGEEVVLRKGGYLNIPAHAKHRVSWTAPDCLTIWLAVFYC